MKGVSEFMTAVILLVISVTIASFIASWITTVSQERSSSVQNRTAAQLECQSANIYIKSATYNCNNNCAAGTAHTTTLTVVNSGKRSLGVDRIYIQNTTGSIFTLNLNQTHTIDPGITKVLTNVTTETCDGINRTIEKVIINSVQCPNTAFDSLRGKEVNFNSC